MEKRRLNDLPEELILKIFSLLPMFEESFVTHLMSKRWEDPCKLVPDVTLEYDKDSSLLTLKNFIYGSLLSNDVQILERLHLKLVRKYKASNINFCVQTAVYRYVRKLRFDLYGGTLKLPSCLSTCTTLKSLILREAKIKVVPLGFCLPSLKSLHLFSVKFPKKESVAILLQCCPDLEYLVLTQTKDDNMMPSCLSTCTTLKSLILREVKIKVVPLGFCLPSLKSLHLFSVEFPGKESVASLLQCCPDLEYLVLNQTKDDNMSYINVPSLKSLSINNSRKKSASNEENHMFWIKAPALENLNFKDTVSNYLMFEYMPEVIKAKIEVICEQSENFIGSLNMIEHLSLCSLATQAPYPRGTFFPYLEHLELCTCSMWWANLLAYILNDAPRIRSLKLESHSARGCCKDRMDLWIEPTVVPESISKNLEILEWRQYEGTEQERQVAAYILANATYLKMATFWTRCRDKYTELKKMSIVSETCRSWNGDNTNAQSKMGTYILANAYLSKDGDVLDKM